MTSFTGITGKKKEKHRYKKHKSNRLIKNSKPKLDKYVIVT